MISSPYRRLLAGLLLPPCAVTGLAFGDGFTEPGNYTIHENIVGRSGFEIQTSGIFAIWWDAAFDHRAETEALFCLLNEVRNDVRDNLGLGDPPNPGAGYYYNVFIHHGEEDRFPNEWGNGQGFDPEGFPYLTLPAGAHEDTSNVLHEGFHVFQASSAYDVVDTNLDAVWIVESSAEWYQSSRNASDPRAFITAGSVYALPHLALWYTPENGPPTVDPSNEWLYGVRPYSTSVFLHYLTNIESVDRAIISGVYSTNSQLTAQEYIYNEVGGDNLRTMFADWAAQTAVGFDYLTEDQLEVTMDELDFFTDPDEVNAHAIELTGEEANGTFRPQQRLKPGGWAYNSIKINNSADATYTFDITGDATGSQGSASHFEARLAVVNGPNVTYQDVPMTDDLSGRVSLNATSSDGEIYLVIASVPDHLVGSQTYGYDVEIGMFTAPEHPPGDYDRNGVVDAADYNAWRAQYGAAVDRVGDGADGNRDGLIDAADYTIWRDNLGKSLNSSGVSPNVVPEPNSILLIILGVAALHRVATATLATGRRRARHVPARPVASMRKRTPSLADS